MGRVYKNVFSPNRVSPLRALYPSVNYEGRVKPFKFFKSTASGMSEVKERIILIRLKSTQIPLFKACVRLKFILLLFKFEEMNQKASRMVCDPKTCISDFS